MTNVQQPKFNYPMIPSMIERYLARGKRVSDEMLLDAVQSMAPSFLPSDMQAVVTKQLDPTMKRSGRPSGKKTSRHEVADDDRRKVSEDHRDMIPRQRTVDDRHAHFAAYLPEAPT